MVVFLSDGRRKLGLIVPPRFRLASREGPTDTPHGAFVDSEPVPGLPLKRLSADLDKPVGEPSV
jgi:hypothetical protein